MAATVLEGYSTEQAQVQPPNYAPLKPNQYEGRVRTANFTKTFASEVSTSDFGLCVIPKGARILGGEICVSATMGTCTFAIGLMDKAGSGFIDAALSVSDNTAFFLAAVALTTTAQTPFAITQALNYLYETEKECYLTLTLGTASAGTQVLKGSLRYVVD